MRCLQCGKRVSLLRKLTDGEFCSDEHRQLFQQQQNDLALARLIEAQQGMSRPRVKAAAAPVKPQPKAATKHAAEENTPPFGDFLKLPVALLRSRRLQVPAFGMIWPEFNSAVPTPEFRTKIQGIRSTGDVVIPAAGACGSPRLPLGATLTWLPGPYLPELPPNDCLPEIAALVPLPAPTEPADPPMADLLAVGVSALDQPESGVCISEPVRLAAARGAVRRLPAREGEETAPAPLAGLLPVRLAAARFAYGPVVLDSRSLPSRGRLALPVARLAVESAVGLPPADAVFALPLDLDARRPDAERHDFALYAAAWPAARAVLPREAGRVRGLNLAAAHDLFSVGAGAACPAGPVIRGCGPFVSRNALAGCEASVPGATLSADPFEFGAWQEQQTLALEQLAQEREGKPPASCEFLLPLALPGAAFLPSVMQSWVGAGEFEIHEALLPLVSTEFAQDPFQALLERMTAPPAEASETLVAMPALEPGPAGFGEAEPSEDEVEAAPPLLTRLNPILVWRLCEPPPVEIRTPSAVKLTMWERAIATEPGVPRLSVRPDNAESTAASSAATKGKEKGARVSLRSRFRLPEGWKVWQHAPADLKWVAVGLPLILALVLYSFRGSQPKEEAGVKLATSQSQSILGGQFASLQKVIMQRAAIHLLDDFRGGLSAWEGKPGWAKSWKYGQATFLEPGQLAVYKPTLPMKDYTIEFLGQIERQGLSWVVRADGSLRNYHVMRLVVTRPGPLPEAAIVRYTVVDGKEGPVTTLPMPFPIKLSTMYRVRVEVSGKEITTYVQGQVVDSFTDTRLRGGGVGFFAAKGEKSFLRWVEVTHQYDYLGRFCAVLAPYDVQAGGKRAD